MAGFVSETPGHSSNLQDYADEEVEDDNLFGDDDSDNDKNYEPQSSESSESDDNDVRHNISKPVKNKVRAKSITNPLTSTLTNQNLLDEDLYLTSDEYDSNEHEVDLEEESIPNREVKNASKCKQKGKNV
ncbi:hypothetical protein J6590_086970 [Homalodisca vitripennis]|nr:hypothetical protein J6590_086970 [Homalodisca vitripennis]